jgi:hypothetical protein
MRILIDILIGYNIPVPMDVKKAARQLVILSVIILLASCSDDSNVEPRLDTKVASDAAITSTTAALKGEFTFLGNMKIIEYGIELSRNQLFSPSQNKGINGAPDLGEFEVNFTGLDPGTVYYFKAYALINTAYVYSKNVEQFTTKQ